MKTMFRKVMHYQYLTLYRVRKQAFFIYLVFKKLLHDINGFNNEIIS